MFVTVEHRVESGGETVIRERQDIVYRATQAQPVAAARPRRPETPREPAGHSLAVEATPTLLFRYSALTFNGHRIHYDPDYARNVEHYPGLVVHGPLQATLMMHLAANRRLRAPFTFAYRGVAPLTHRRTSVNALRWEAWSFGTRVTPAGRQ